MRRIVNRRSKKALTLVELVVAMALTMIFMGACVMLVYPVEKIYTHTNDLSRAQLVADSVVNSIRAECSLADVSSADDFYIAPNSSGSDYGNALYFRRSNDYVETIASNYAISPDDVDDLRTAMAGASVGSGVDTKAVFRMSSNDMKEGYVHFGYFGLESSPVNAPSGWSLYDYTNPFAYGTYNGYEVRLLFTADKDSSGNTISSYVRCDVTVLKNGTPVYTRNTILCFS
jgi:hypothetical protein